MATTYTAAQTHYLIGLAGSVLKANAAVGEVTAIVNTSHPDRQNDIMATGCWQKCISERQTPLIFWAHELGQLPLGKISRLEEVAVKAGGASGLKATMNFAMDTTRGRDAYQLISAGIIKEYSVQFTVAPENESRDYNTGMRTVRLVDSLLEVSGVIKGASLGTQTLDVKSAYDRVQSQSSLDQVVAEYGYKAAAEIEKRLSAQEWRTDPSNRPTFGEIMAEARQNDSEAIYQRAYQKNEIARQAGLSPYPSWQVADRAVARHKALQRELANV